MSAAQLLALTRPPSAALARCELTHLPRRPIDVERALAQHGAFRAALEALGVEVLELSAQPDLPDAAFVEDAAVVLDEVAVIGRPGAASRRAETESVARALAAHRELFRIEEPCTLEGGDVLRVDDVLFVGQAAGPAARTSHAGLRALAHLVLPLGHRVKAVELRGCLHLKTGCTHLGEDTLLANPAWVDLHRARGLRVIPVAPEEPFAANALRVGDVVLMAAGSPRTAERVAAAGFDVRTLDVSELQKAEAGVTCLGLLFAPRR